MEEEEKNCKEPEVKKPKLEVNSKRKEEEDKKRSKELVEICGAVLVQFLVPCVCSFG